MKKTLLIMAGLALLAGLVYANSVTVTNRGQVFTVSLMPTPSDRTDADQVVRHPNLHVGDMLTVGGATTIVGATGIVGPLTAARVAMAPAISTTNAVTLTSAHFGKVVPVTAAGAVAITLPPATTAVGTVIDVVIVGSDATAPTIAAAVAGTLITPNDAEANSVTFGTGHRIGAAVRFIATGTKWLVINLGGTTMTVAT